MAPAIYSPDRLHVLSPCKTLNGLVVVTVPEDDGDHHIWVTPDSDSRDLMNPEDHFQGRPTMLAEIVPACAPGTKMTSGDEARKCPPTSLTIPRAGQHVSITGPWILDTNHGWNEIHPVLSVSVSA